MVLIEPLLCFCLIYCLWFVFCATHPVCVCPAICWSSFPWYLSGLSLPSVFLQHEDYTPNPLWTLKYNTEHLDVSKDKVRVLMI